MDNRGYKVLKVLKELKGECDIKNSNFVVDTVYSYYVNNMVQLDLDDCIACDDMKKLLFIIYDVFSLRMSMDDILYFFKDYMTLIIHDILDGNSVDIKWLIDYLWYFNHIDVANKFMSTRCDDLILFLQDRLVKEFNISESVKDRFLRKASTCILK